MAMTPDEIKIMVDKIRDAIPSGQLIEEDYNDHVGELSLTLQGGVVITVDAFESLIACPDDV